MLLLLPLEVPHFQFVQEGGYDSILGPAGIIHETQTCAWLTKGKTALANSNTHLNVFKLSMVLKKLGLASDPSECLISYATSIRVEVAQSYSHIACTL